MMFRPSDLEVMARVRAVFDPEGRCNPNKVLPQRNACAEPAKWPQMVARVLDGPAPGSPGARDSNGDDR
jgi:hypothetical protein